jgi:MoaA/NifB/PqqE/SkfB family radical SAM enzyme
MVTNGTHLARRATDLARLGLKDITVSVDSSIPAAHDKLRGSSGAFERTFAGIRAALSEETFRSRLVVASVLLPGKRHLLDGMPRLLADNGVKYFGVTPFIKVPRSGFGRMIQEHGSLMDDLERLRVASEESGVQFVVDDELARFRHVFDGANKFMIHSLSRPGRLIRLTPSGACSIGLDVLRQVSEVTPRWQPRVESGASFLSRLNLEAPPLWPEPTLCVAA